IMIATDGVLLLAPRPPKQKLDPNMPIDRFFCSLAEVHQAHAIGVVLSGTATDGTLGLKAIKDHGGLPLRKTKHPPRLKECHKVRHRQVWSILCCRPIKSQPKSSKLPEAWLGAEISNCINKSKRRRCLNKSRPCCGSKRERILPTTSKRRFSAVSFAEWH
ncbi:MAG: hypothetical protein KAY96_06160, partial [Bacteroidia bacterium]|nr:hypothetical protein [Bacteroidia bacterium]